MEAFGERIIVEKIMEPNKLKGVSISSEKIYNNKVTVVSVGEDVTSRLNAGDILKLAAESGTYLEHEGNDYLVIVKQNILAKL